ncbi:MAG: redoxin domain-containing protein [Myxococcota bacterium]|nr:redoxin domain-containing protein [Myxococcota bacterium]
MNWKILGVGIAVTAPLFWVLVQGFGQDPRALPSVLEGRAAPAFTLDTLQGESVSLGSLEGRPVVLNFWATWCQPCAQEHPILSATARRYRNHVDFYGVLYQDEPTRARMVVERQGEDYPTLVDPEGRVAIDYGVGGVPETFILDGQGQIHRKITGPVHEQELLEILEGLL